MPFDDLYDNQGQGPTREPAPHSTGGAPGRAPVTARLAPRPIQYVFRVADAESATALGDALGRDANQVAAGADAAVERAAGSSGQPLPGGVRQRFESSLGVDLAGVRVHTGVESQQAARAVGARAYTVGQDIHFAENQFSHDDPFGMHLLAHEVAHTVQQRGGTAHRQHKLEVSTPGDSAEVEADRAADAMVAGQRAAVGGAGGALHRDPDPWPEKDNDPRPGESGGRGARPEGNPEKERGDEEESARRTAEMHAYFAGKEVSWAGMSGAASLDAKASPWTSSMPEAQTDRRFKGHALERTYVGAIGSVWSQAQSGWNALVPVVNDYANAGAKAKDLRLMKDLGDSANQGWDAPKGSPNMAEYAEQQGAAGGPKVKDMFEGGKLHDTYQRFHSERSGFSDHDGKDNRHDGGKKGDKQLLGDALKERTDALGEVIKAATHLENTTGGDAKSKLLAIANLEIDIESCKLSEDEKQKQKEILDITRERDRINGLINAGSTTIDGVLGVMKAETMTLKTAATLKATAGTATALINIGYAEQIGKIQSAVAGIAVKMENADLRKALNAKEKALADYQTWLRTALVERTGDVSKAYGVYKQKHENACLLFRTAAENKVKADHAARDAAAPPGDPDKPESGEGADGQKRQDAEEVAQAGREMEALMRALPVIETVVTAAERGTGVQLTTPEYTKDSGIGFGLIGSPSALPEALGNIESISHAFNDAHAMWTQRHKQVSEIITSYAL
jgi:hypothetical protein